MTTDAEVEELLARSVESITVDADPDEVVRAVDARRSRQRSDTRRRHRMRAIVGLGTAAAALAVVALVAVGPPDDLSSIDAAAPPTSGPSTVAPTTAGSATVSTVQLPGSGDIVTALGSDDTGFWVSRGTPATVTRVERNATVGASTRLQGTALVAAADPTHLWLLVEEPDAGDQPYRLKQIDRADGDLLASHVVALGGAPTGLDVRSESIIARWSAGAVELDRDGTQLATATNSDAVRQQVTSGVVSWSLTEPIDGAARLSSTDPSGQDRTATLEGARRLVAAPALGPGVVAIERLVDDRVVVDSRRVADDPAPVRLTTLAADSSLAWVTSDELWVIDGPELERRPR